MDGSIVSDGDFDFVVGYFNWVDEGVIYYLDCWFYSIYFREFVLYFGYGGEVGVGIAYGDVCYGLVLGLAQGACRGCRVCFVLGVPRIE